jgi:hypothetical protein
MNAVDPDHYRLRVVAGPDTIRVNERGQTVVAVECFDVLEALGLEQNAYRMCAFKYLWRAGRKTLDPLTDLKKAVTYLSREIARLEDHRKRFPDAGAAPDACSKCNDLSAFLVDGLCSRCLPETRIECAACGGTYPAGTHHFACVPRKGHSGR